MARLDVHDLPPSQRHTTIDDAFDEEGYEVERHGPEEFVATLLKNDGVAKDTCGSN